LTNIIKSNTLVLECKKEAMMETLKKNDTYKIISKKLKDLREFHKLSQQEFGERIGVSGQNIYRYENNIVNLPIDVMFAIMESFNLPIDYFIDEDMPPYNAKAKIREEFSEPVVVAPKEEKEYINKCKFTACPIIESVEITKGEKIGTGIKSAVKNYMYIPYVKLEEGEDLFGYQVKDYASFPEAMYGDVVVVKMFKEDPNKKLSPKYYIQPDKYPSLCLVRLVAGSELAFAVRHVMQTEKEWVCYSGTSMTVLRKSSLLEQPIGAVLGLYRFDNFDNVQEGILHVSAKYRDIL
jgi:transcriptional regulator with XRE-family HTH domain